MRSLLLAALFLPLAAFADTAGAGATPAAELKVADGFKVELLRSASKEEGSWICMAIDDKGRLYISCQGKPPGAGMKNEDQWGGLYRVTLDGQGQVGQWEQVPVPIGDAMGMLWAFDSLYVSGEGPEGRGIYRLKAAPDRDTLTTWSMWKKVPGGNGEHGAHALILGPDKKSIYVVHGNSTPLIEGTEKETPYRNYAEDDLLPRVMDPVATFFDKIKAPYGCVFRTDENGTKWDIVAGGFRNPYDIDFNADGELFTYDSDMEWDVGLPWYRPTRILHIIPGGEFGFREGSAKWPDSYADSLPAVVNIGLGCPTGVKFGTKSNFPTKYKQAFFVLDWTFGRILAVHLHPKGASYTAENALPSPYYLTGPASSPDVEEFVKGKGLPVTDVEFGLDGSMYFTIGGRGTQAGLYRVSYTGGAGYATQPGVVVPAPHASDAEEEARMARNYRRAMEADTTTLDDGPGFARTPSRVRAAIENDRYVYFAARTRAERLPLDQLRKLTFEEPLVREGVVSPTDAHDRQYVQTLDSLMGFLALARMGTKDDQEPLLKALGKLPLAEASDDLKLIALRVLEVTLIRQGRPSTDAVEEMTKHLSAAYPAKSFAFNRELVQLLVYLGAPDVVEKTLSLMDKTEEPAEQVWYATCLREAGNWTPAQRERYFSWFAKARAYHGGNSFGKFILRIRDQALEKLPEAERPALLALAEKVIDSGKPAFPMPARPFVKMWAMTDLEPALGGVTKGRDFARGKKLFTEAMCAQCHLFAGTGGTAKGGAIGPDLTAVGSRFSARDILESIVEPSKVISEQYQSFLFTMKDGSTIGGQVAEENHYLITLIVDPINGTRQNIPKGNVVKREVSPISMMPPGLLATLSQEDVLDLIAYLQSGGNEKAPAFEKSK